MSSKFLEELSDDYEKLLETEIGYDVVIYAGEESDIKEIHAHSNILCIRSRYFRTAFSNEWAEKKDGKFIFKKPNISPHLFNIILRFIYSGNIELKNLQGPDILKLLIAVDELDIQRLVSHIQEYLIKHQTEFLHQNPSGILETVYQHETFTYLWDFYLEKICEKPKILFNSDTFINLKAPLLELLLKRNNLNMDEIEIWEGLLKWSFAQQNIENYDPTNLSNDDIIKIKRSLHRFIPLIGFYNIEPTDFFYKVYNYKDILPQDLMHDLLEFHIIPNVKPKTNVPQPRKSNFGSTLIQPNHIPLFASWIDKNDSLYYDNKNVPYDFKLLYHSGRDGFDAASFHKNCDNKGATIWVAKIQGTTQLVGGYNPLDWNGNGVWKTTRDSFLFNFTDGNNISTAKLGYVKNPGWAVYCANNQGPHMGGFLCHGNNDWRNCDVSANYYPNIGIPNISDIPSFTVKVYEVFQVIKK
ncbi:hypothetical protein RclHR1_05100004 [Rhizophagus clarus]|uniref:BTB domain-containing protein n=1 Tax=Rhizophagus clarus TaxID=94130 RepID=A0A2Z6RKH6_9GLOM|nr:hypothetical protein RclHR1_05100004 [Rhizophagus clarus]GES86433.1 hypothetical protein GLOIN_2v1876134 [Rhizophagus clarus]